MENYKTYIDEDRYTIPADILIWYLENNNLYEEALDQIAVNRILISKEYGDMIGADRPIFIKYDCEIYAYGQVFQLANQKWDFYDITGSEDNAIDQFLNRSSSDEFFILLRSNRYFFDMTVKALNLNIELIIKMFKETNTTRRTAIKQQIELLRAELSSLEKKLDYLSQEEDNLLTRNHQK